MSRYARRLVDAGFFPGMGIAVTRADSVVYVGSFGYADMKSGRRVNDRTRFYIASTTKALTATAVVIEASRGQLKLDAPITTYLPGLRFKAPLQARSITARDLLRMTDGIGSCDPVGFRTAYTGVYTQQLLIRLLTDCGPSATGGAFAYRNLPYILLGAVLAPGKTRGWESTLRRVVLDPLGMDETTARPSTLNPTDIAMPYRIAPDGGFERIRLAKTDANMHAAGGYFSTPRDLAKFVAMSASNGILNGRQVFPARVIASTHMNHAAQNHDFGPYHRDGWGYGWDLGTFEGHEIVHRFGGFPGYRSHVSFMPASGIGVVVLVNGLATPFAADEMADYIYDRIKGQRTPVNTSYDAVFQKLLKRKTHFARYFAKQESIRLARQRQTLPHPLSSYAGTYTNPSMGRLRWRIVNDHLEVTAGVARSRADIYAAERNQFRIELTGHGQVTSFSFAGDKTHATALTYDGHRFTWRSGE